MHPLGWLLGNLAAGKQVHQELDPTQFTGFLESFVIIAAFSLCLCQKTGLPDMRKCPFVCPYGQAPFRCYPHEASFLASGIIQRTPTVQLGNAILHPSILAAVCHSLPLFQSAIPLGMADDFFNRLPPISVLLTMCFPG